MKGVPKLRLLTVSLAFIILCVAAGSGQHSCPSVCTCYVDELYGLRTANCSGANFLSEYKYNKLFHEIEVLNIQTDSDDNPISLWDDMFVSLTKLKLLNLSKCKINHLPKNVFKGLKKIYEINLSYNNIKHFDNSVFENIYTLYKLNLRGNTLQASYKPFISSSSLRDLDLGYCSMTVLPNEFFHGLKKVVHLNLDGNHLQTIKEHVLPRGITHLNLASNRIVSVPISTIASLNQLRWINLGANPINCTCSLLNLQDRLSGRGVIIDGDVRCAYPLELENISWSKINENELCIKETFRSRLHYRKSQSSKYIHSHKKDQYFENEKYNPLESFQGDDPGKSADYDNLLSAEDGYDEPKSAKMDSNVENDNQDAPLENDAEPVGKTDEVENADGAIKDNSNSENIPPPTKDSEAQAQNLAENESKDKENYTPITESEAEVINDGNVDSKNSEKQIALPTEDNHDTETQVTASANPEENVNSDADPQKDNGDDKNENGADIGKDADDEEVTEPPMTTDADFIIPDTEINGAKSSLDGLDEGSKREDEIIPVSVSAPTEGSETDIKNNINGNDNFTSNGIDTPGTGSISTEANETKKTDDGIANNYDIEAPIVPEKANEYFSENKNDLEDSNKGHQDLETETSKDNNEEQLNPVPDNSPGDGNENLGLDLDKKTENHICSTQQTIVENEEEGSGDDSVPIHVGSTLLPILPDDENDATPETKIIPPPESPEIPDLGSSPPKTDDSEPDADSNKESSRQVVDKESMSYEAMGPYIVVVGIILLITVLIIVSIYKGVCKRRKQNEKPVADLEASNGTELQDIKSLLPQTPVNGEKHNNKYPNEVPSPETVNLIKEDKTEDNHESNESHDLNQNDSKNEPVMKNGKAPEGSPPPIEITKAKLTVLLESIPRTPIFVQKKSSAS